MESACRVLAGVCGRYCADCAPEYDPACRGCAYQLGRTCRGECAIFQCCLVERGLEHCGLCQDFPCDTFADGEKPESVECRRLALVERSTRGTDAWVAERRRRAGQAEPAVGLRTAGEAWEDMTKVICRQRRCRNWERGDCLADQITIDHLGGCLEQDRGERLNSGAEDDRSPDDTAEVEWEADSWMDEDLDDEDDDEDDREEPGSSRHRPQR